jgi:DNA sulfur modification protein DndD
VLAVGDRCSAVPATIVLPPQRVAFRTFATSLITFSCSFSFNLLCRKKDNMRRISIDPNTFALTVIDRDGHPIPKSQLSAGEKQVYAISMLCW